MKDNTVLTPHFKLREFTESATAMKHGIDNRPTPEVVENLRRLCTHTLEPLGLPIIITSGYRTKELNEIIVHASRKSQHMEGRAADFVVSGFKFQVSSPESHRELLIRAFRLIITDPEVDFDKVIIYPTFIHVSFVSPSANRHSIMEAKGDGKYKSLTRADALSLV